MTPKPMGRLYLSVIHSIGFADYKIYKKIAKKTEINLTTVAFICIIATVRKLHIGDWSNGMIGVSKTFGGSSILSSPAIMNAERSYKSRLFSVFDFP